MPNDPIGKPPRRRSPALYRLVLAIPLVMLLYLIASGRAGAYVHLFGTAARGPVDEQAFDDAFLTGILWIVSVTPLMLAAWELGARHTDARRRGFEMFVGLKQVFRIALFGDAAWASVKRDEELARSPKDELVPALLFGAAVAIGVPIFFSSFVPQLRTAAGLTWLIVAGLLMGGSMYCRQRAVAYLRDEPRRWDFFRQWRLLNPNRYEPRGRVFARWLAALTVAFPIWWLVAGALFLFSS